MTVVCDIQTNTHVHPDKYSSSVTEVISTHMNITWPFTYNDHTSGGVNRKQMVYLVVYCLKILISKGTKAVK